MHGVEVVPPRKEPIPGEPLKQPEVKAVLPNPEPKTVEEVKQNSIAVLKKARAKNK